ncbi:hypothetical protein BgiBS90_025272 [Biomphalaria glabrata]|nr:hypothetical protein BgiBS90_025272 [Biomphalaria glabrata]
MDLDIDWVKLEDEVRKQQGHHECEISFLDETDLQKYKKQCTKNPNHESFIPANDFSIRNLPNCYQDPRIVDLVKVLSELTVKVKVSFTSANRPKVFPQTATPYPFHKCRGSDKFARTGTGRCVDFYKRSDVDDQACPCKACKISGKPVKTWAAVIVHTATHVVFDNSEAEFTECVLCYDSDEDRGVNLEAVDIVGGRADTDGDRCLLRCVTHDIGVVDILWQMSRIYRDLFKTVKEKCSLASPDGQRLVVIVSHPHGCAKCVTLGHCTEESLGQFGQTRFTYTTATCPGSSGAPVMVFGRGNEWWNHTHSGATPKGNISSEIFILE